MQERNLKENPNLVFKDDVYYSEGDLVLENGEYYLKGNLQLIGTLTLNNANLVVEGVLRILADYNVSPISTIVSISISTGNIYAKSIVTYADIEIHGGNLTTFSDLSCCNIFSDGDIYVGGNTDVFCVSCNNYLVDGKNDSLNINADKSVYIMDYCECMNITAPEVFLASGGNFNGGDITANYFEIGEGSHIKNCFYRHFL